MRIVHGVFRLALLGWIVVLGVDGAGAQGTAQEQQACTPDAMRLCGDAIPDVAKVTSCMKAKYSQLSEPCRLAMRGGGGERSSRHAARERTHYRHARGAPKCDPFSHLCS